MTTQRLYHLPAMLATVLVLAVLGSTAVMAQRFQCVYGGPACVEAGRAGVTQLRNGGYVAVGETYSTGFPCGASHIYVIYTNPNNTLVWSNYYIIGVNDSALDVVECCNGDIAICGVVNNPFGCNPGREAFLLRLTNAGAVVAVNTYGTPGSDEIAWNLAEALTGDGVVSNPGDFIVCGSTTLNAGFNAGAPARDGYIFRTNAALGLIWGQHYGGPGSRDDYFYGITECGVGVVPGVVGDIAVTGGTNTWGVGGYDIWEVRVNGNNGFIGAAPQNAATYGGPLDDEGRAIIELRFATNPGDLVVTGISFSPPAPNASSEVVMLQTTNNPCVKVADLYAGENAVNVDGGMDLKEDAFPSTPCGDVIVTGFTDWGIPINPPNVFLQKFAAGSMLPVGGGMAYGGVGDDRGWSVDNCRRNLFCTQETEGYVVAGYTQSGDLIGADPEQLYLIKTDRVYNSGCNQAAFNFIIQAANLIRQCPRPPILAINPSCIPNITQVLVNWRTPLCYFYPVARQGGGGEGDGVANVKPPVMIPFVGGSVSSYPNPLNSGVPLNLRFDMARNANAEVTVTDIGGHVVYQENVAINAGSELKVIPTTGWASGTYIVRLSVDKATSTTKIVLAD